MAKITLTKTQLANIKKDMHEQVEMLTDAEVNAIAIKLNKAVNLPFLNETRELQVFGKIIKWVEKKLYELLPNEYYELIKNSSDGVSEEEASLIEERVTPLINNVINIPVLTEKQEAKLIGLVLSIIIRALIKGCNLEQVEPEDK